MSSQMLQLGVLSAILVSMLNAGSGFASPTTSSGLFQLTELPGLSSAHAVEVAAKCGSGACGSKDDGQKKDGNHQCGSKKDGEHQCGSGKKDGNHQCGSKKDGNNVVAVKRPVAINAVQALALAKPVANTVFYTTSGAVLHRCSAGFPSQES